MHADSSDLVAVRGIRARGYHGVFPVERRDGQVFVVDVVVAMDTRPAASTDDLNLTVNYAELAKHVVEAIEGAPVNLLETLAERVANVAMTGPARWVEVTVHKPEAPIEAEFSDVSVRIRRPRPTDLDPPEGTS